MRVEEVGLIRSTVSFRTKEYYMVTAEQCLCWHCWGKQVALVVVCTLSAPPRSAPVLQGTPTVRRQLCWGETKASPAHRADTRGIARHTANRILRTPTHILRPSSAQVQCAELFLPLVNTTANAQPSTDR
jgi:hypothetical protein